MTHQKRYLLFALFALVTFINTAFIFKNSKKPTLSSSSQSLEAPPQYKVQKLPFFEKIIVNKVFRKIRKDGKKPIDLDKLAKQSRLFNIITCLTGLFTLIFIWIYPIIALLMLTLTLIFGLITASKANHVYDNLLSTPPQKRMVKRSEKVGCFGFLMTLACFIGALFLSLYGYF
jgi:hypothetical protein